MSIFGKMFGKKTHGPAHTAGVSSLQAFAARYAQAARDHFNGIEATIVLGASAAESRVELLFADGGKFNQFLGNLWQRYQVAPDDEQVIFGEQFASIGQTRVNWDDNGADDTKDTTKILPVLKTRAWYETSLAQLEQAGMLEGRAPLLVTPYAGELVVTYVKDTPQSMDYLGAEEAEQLGLQGEALHAHALENLARMLPELEVKGGGGRYAARLDRNYDASMVLLFDRWRDRIDVDGDPVFAIAARDELLVAGSNDPTTLVQLQEMANDIVGQSAYALSSRLFLYRDGHLTPLMIATKGDQVVIVEVETGMRLNGSD